MINKVPKYIYDAIKKREKYTALMVHYDSIVSEFVRKNGIDAEDYISLSAVVIGEPYIASEQLKLILEEFEKEKNYDNKRD